MCLFPRLIYNKKYTATKKNKGIIPPVQDTRVLYVPIGCQQCIECRKQRARAWTVRLNEEIRQYKANEKQFVTLTFSNEAINEIQEELPQSLNGYERDNATAVRAVRLFLERWRKHNGTSIKHWLVTELGHQGTENIHLHGIIFSKDKAQIKERWQYGFVYFGDYVNERTVSYIAKYITKQDFDHPNYNAKILTSPGIGSNYLTRADSKLHKYRKKGNTKETYETRQGYKMNLPIYYRNKIYTENERELLWLEKLDKEIRWIWGNKVSVKNGDYSTYEQCLKYYQQKNRRLGYGDGSIDWNAKQYEQERRNLLNQKRREKFAQINKTNEC